MKKFIAFILTLAYLTSTSGATIVVQQCMGKTVGWSLSPNSIEKCSNCGMKKNVSTDCCKGHIKVLKVHNDQNLPESNFQNIFLPIFILPEVSKNIQQCQVISPIQKVIKKRPPPFTDYCILYCSFLI